jgi:hypothetical protein
VKSRVKALTLEEKHMFNVGNNLLGNSIPPLGAGPPAQLAGAASAAQGAAANVLADAISPAPQPAANAQAQPAFAWPGSANGPGGFIAQFMALIFNAYTQLAQFFGSLFGQSPWQPSPTMPLRPMPHPEQQFFTSATASSTGDPHDTFSGTTANGQTIDGGRWSNMSNHPYLLNSDSFAGGFRVSTNVSAPNRNGVTQNDYVSVESDFGRNVVTMNKDGSFSVVENGKSLDLGVGQTRNLGNGETVTLNADRSLTVVEQNGFGGEITATLRANGQGGVNVRASAKNVDLGGYLVERSEGDATPIPVDQPPGPLAATALPPTTLPYVPYAPQPHQPYQPQPYQPYQPYAADQQSAAGALVGV